MKNLKTVFKRMDNSDIGILRWGNEKATKCKTRFADGSPLYTWSSENSETMHPSASLDVKGAPLCHPVKALSCLLAKYANYCNVHCRID